MQGEPVFFVRFHQVDPLRHAQPGVEPLGLPECLPGAGDGHEVSRGGEHQRGFRRSHQNVVRMVHAVGGLSEDVLLRIARPRFVVLAASGGDETARCRSHDSRVERHQVGGHEAAARVPGATDARLVDVVPARQVVDAADAVPDAIGRQVLTQQNGGDAGQIVFSCGAESAFHRR